jgi:hypothetical protein
MKKKKKFLFMSLSIFFISFLLNTYSLDPLSISALVEEKNNHYNTNSFDFSTWKWNMTEVVSTISTSDSYYP